MNLKILEKINRNKPQTWYFCDGLQKTSKQGTKRRKRVKDSKKGDGGSKLKISNFNS